MFRFITIFSWIGCLFAAGTQTGYAQPSVLSSGKWYKVEVVENGVYRIDQSTLSKMGFTGNVDPRNIRIYSFGSGMLPQANSAPRPADLLELAIYVQGEADGVFNSQDYVLFYAEGPDKVRFDTSREIFSYEKNHYAKSNGYFITVSDTPGKRINLADSQGSDFPVIKEFQNYVYHELDQYNELKSGREWFGERFDLITEVTLRFNLSNVVANSTMKLVSDVMAQSFGTSSFKLFLNGTQVGDQTVLPIPNTQYGIKGRHALDTFQINAATAGANNLTTQEVRYQYIKSPASRSVGFLDYCLLQVTQQLKLYGSQTIFRSTASLQHAVSKFEIEQSNGQALVWDITNPFEPVAQSTSFTTGITSFSASTTSLREFIVFLPNAPLPGLVGTVTNQNLKSGPTPDFIIVTHPDFKDEVMRLKAHRESSGLNVLVATTTEVYNELSGGKQDVTAIRDLAKFHYDQNPGTLKGLLLFGKCSYDYKDILVDNKNFVATYQSRNSLHPLQTYSSDDYFGFLEDHEGEWSESPAVNHTLDIGVGRLPVKSVSEANDVVDKIIRYETDSTLFHAWRKRIVFVADDGDFNIHQGQADDMARNIDENFGMYDVRKIYLDAFPQVPGASGETSPETKKQIDKAFDEGALIINYTGHGAERLWAQERIFDEVQIRNLKNERLPLLVTATCEFGRQDDPVFPSGGELCMLQPNGGAIGLVTTARPVSASTNFELNQAFYAAFFQKQDGKNLTLGEIFRRTKNNSLFGVANRNFSLIGDPMLYLAMPEYQVRVNSITTTDNSNLLKALSKVTVSGEITDESSSRVEMFNGVAEATLFDKKTTFVTLGNENPAFTYSQWFNALFRGQATVENGAFQFEFTIPKNIAYAIDQGKLSVYAYHQSENLDASGFSQDFLVGSSEPNPETDSTPPDIQLFMGDMSFVSGGITGPNTKLIVRLSDTNGINISGYGIGNSIVAVLDDSESFILNEYYYSDVNDFTQGTIQFPLNDIPPGKHTITVQAWDTYNNAAQASINFVVTNGNELVIEDFGNYPNPFDLSTRFFFTHNQAGADLEATLVIYDAQGRATQHLDFSIPESNYRVDLFELNRNDDFVRNLNAGLYLARLVVRSLADSSKTERVTKLIIVN